MTFLTSKTSPPANAGLTRAEVVAAYCWLLGREPESEDIVRYALENYKNQNELRQALREGEEFVRGISSHVFARRFPLDLDVNPQPIEVHGDAEAVARLLAHVEETWSRLGKEDPYWSVITHDNCRLDNFERNQEQFWNSGEQEVVRLERWMERNRMPLPASLTCLEFGCGVGRITRSLCQRFDHVLACDISEAHLQKARQAIPAEVSDKVTFLRTDQLRTLDQLPSFDLLFSILVLQHNPPPVMVYILDKLLARLRPGGFAYFQVVTFNRDYRFMLQEYLAAATTEMEMHVLPQQYVFEIAARHRCEAVEVNPDNLTGTIEYVSTTFLLRKA